MFVQTNAINPTKDKRSKKTQWSGSTLPICTKSETLQSLLERKNTQQHKKDATRNCVDWRKAPYTRTYVLKYIYQATISVSHAFFSSFSIDLRRI